MKKLLFSFISLSFFCLFAQANQKEGERLFSLKIRSLLEAKCFACHSQKAGKTKGDLDLSSLENILFGGETSDRILVPDFESFEVVENAIKREKQLKAGKRATKIQLIEKDNPNWDDLSADW